MAQITTFVQRCQTLRAYQDTGNQLIEDLIIYSDGLGKSLREENATLAKNLEDALLDLEDAKKSRRELQLQLSQAQSQISQISIDYDTMKNRNPYVIVLIDGDGLIFNEEFVRQGIEGGKKAASLLRDSVLDNCGSLTNEIEIMAKVCANLGGLSNAMKRGGLVDSTDDFKDFTLGFTQGKASFDFIDVGHGKERADSKIKESVRWHLRSHNCKQILLGVSHDAGYAPFLDEVIIQEDRNRVTLLEGPPTVRELAATNLQILNFNTIFRSEKINRQASNSSPVANATWAGVTSILPPPPTPVPAPAATAQSPAPVQKVLAGKPTWTLSPRGLDDPIKVNVNVLDRVKRRSPKLCNNHYLRGPCVKDDCPFEHDFKPSEEEKKAVAYLSRLNPCQNGQDCELDYCIYGHNCPMVSFVNKKWMCTAYRCRYGDEAHPPGCGMKYNLDY